MTVCPHLCPGIPNLAVWRTARFVSDNTDRLDGADVRRRPQLSPGDHTGRNGRWTSKHAASSKKGHAMFWTVLLIIVVPFVMHRS
jgi:hypothetical protein